MYRIPNFLAILLACLSFSVTSSTQDNLSVSAIPDSLLQRSHTVVRIDKTQVIVDDVDKITMHREFVATVLDEDHRSVLDFEVIYKEGSSELDDFELEYLDYNGDPIIEVKKKELKDEAYNNRYSIISDYRVKRYTYRPSEYPVTIRCNYSIKSKNTSIPGWYPVWPYRTAVELSEYRINNQTDIPIEPKANIPAGINVQTDHPHHYLLKGQKALTAEKYAPEEAIFPSVKFRANRHNYEGIKGSFSNWNELGLWIHKRLLHWNDLDAESIRKSLQGVVTNPQDQHQTAKEIHSYIKENTRYISIGLDEGGLVPMRPSEVDELKYGDCKALSHYMQVLLDAYGIESDYIVVEAGSDKQVSFYPDFFSVEQGNHIIVRVKTESDTFWVDCTMQETPFGFLDDFTDNRLVLAVNERGGEIVKTPEYGPELNYTETTVDLNMKTADSFTLDYFSKMKGINYNTMRLISQKPFEFHRDYLESKIKKLQSIKLVNVSYEFEPDELLVTEQAQFTFKNFHQELGNYLLFPIGLVSLEVPRLPKDKNRKYPIEFVRSYKRKVIQHTQIPDGYDYTEQEKNYNYTSTYGQYSLRIYKEMGRLVSEHEFVLNKGYYPAEEYNDLKSFFDKIRKQERTELTFTKS